MGFIVAALIGAFAFWFINGARKKGVYYAKVENVLRQHGVNPTMLVQHYGQKGYFATLEFMRKQGWSPEETAKGMFDEMQGTHDELLEKIGL